MRKLWQLALACGALANVSFAADVKWAGEGSQRVLVRVDPVKIEPRKSDTMPAEIVVDLSAELKKAKIAGKADIASIQVIRYDAKTGEPLKFDDNAYQKSPYDRPFSWYDDSIPYNFPDMLGSIVRSDGKLAPKPTTRAGYVYNTLGEGDAGHLAWVHTQDGSEASDYAIYFNLLPEGKRLEQVPPRGWLGDGMPRTEQEGASTTGSGHSRIALDDWDDDGLLDIVQGEEYGCLFVFYNRGTKNEPKFPYRKFITDEKGVPIDVGLHAAPLVVDWDNDGKKDLLVGTYTNHLLWFRNVGTNADRKMKFMGYVQADGKTLELPTTPILGRDEKIFSKHDYYPVTTWVDWNGDGQQDLLAGGYVTGRIFFYETTGKLPDGTPKLAFRGPLEADGVPLNVVEWCASPCVADFDGDGDLDVMSGGHPMSPGAFEDRKFLRYYENIGSITDPKLTQKPFPCKGSPSGATATARPADMNADGLIDLVVSVNNTIYFMPNIGSANKPLFDATVKPIPSAWGSAPLGGAFFMDINKDGLLDMIDDYTVRLNSGKGSPYFFKEAVSILPRGVRIDHRVEIGDGWFWPYLYDFDNDGDIDVLFGDWHGTIWYHENRGSTDKPDFDVDGYRLKITDGSEIKVGPIGKDISTDFQALQGARTTFAVADFDGDKLSDLVIGDTYGKIRAYRNAGTAQKPVFDPVYDVGDLRTRLMVDACDWDGDGKQDIIGGSNTIRVFLNQSENGKLKFGEGIDPKLPPLKGPRTVVADINRDGDEDLIIGSGQGTMLVERSFLRNGGYAKGKVVAVESKAK